MPGRRYRAVWSPDLTPGSWSFLNGQIDGTGTVATVLDEGARGRSPRFYRAEVVSF